MKCGWDVGVVRRKNWLKSTYHFEGVPWGKQIIVLSLKTVLTKPLVNGKVYVWVRLKFQSFDQQNFFHRGYLCLRSGFDVIFDNFKLLSIQIITVKDDHISDNEDTISIPDKNVPVPIDIQIFFILLLLYIFFFELKNACDEMKNYHYPSSFHLLGSFVSVFQFFYFEN